MVALQIADLQQEHWEEDSESLRETLAYRATQYALLAQVFQHEPTEEFLQELIAAASSVDDPLQTSIPENEAQLLRRLDRYFAQEGRDVRQAISIEYAELFIGPRPPLAPIYESLYLGSPRRLYTDVTRSVRAFYEQHGFEVSRKNRIPDDHLGYELEFMARLCAVTLESVGDSSSLEYLIESQRQFLETHVQCWIGLLRERIEAAVPNGYYLVWIKYAEDYIKEDIQLLAHHDTPFRIAPLKATYRAKRYSALWCKRSPHQPCNCTARMD